MLEKQKGFSPFAEIFPLLPDDELKQLAADIDANGMREPIQLDADGLILDGRNRYRAACDKCMQPKVCVFRKWNGRATPELYMAYVISANIHRRQLTISQRAQAIVSANDLAARLGKGRQKRTEKPPSLDGNADLNVSRDTAPAPSKAAQAEAAGVSVPSISRARRVQAECDTDTQDAVIRGEISASEAIARAKPDPEPDAEPDRHDHFGNVLPEHVVDSWDDTQVVAEIKRRVDACRRDIEAYCHEYMAAAYVESRLKQIQSDLKAVGSAINLAMPYAMCPYCGGDAPKIRKCRNCRDLGWLPRDLYQQTVAAELKWESR